MMQPYDENRAAKMAGVIAVALYVAIFGSLCLWGGFTLDVKQEQGGMLVDFGGDDSGMGVDDTLLADEVAPPKPVSQPEVQPVETQEVEPEAPEQEEGDLIVDKEVAPEEELPEEVAQEEQEPEEEKPREVNKLALFPGNTPEAESQQQGRVDSLAGNQGYIGGAQVDNYVGTGGEGGFEPDWNLEGRRPKNEFPRPKYVDNAQGTVVVEIWVDNNGNVTQAFYRPQGSTVSAQSSLVREALSAARGVKFDQSDEDIQVGTITYHFKLNTNQRRAR